MAITAAAIEANGWVLRLTLSGSPGSFATYTLDPDGSPRVNLAVTHPGFVQSAGTAVAGSCARALVATKPLRKPVNPAAPTTPVIDETDNGDGTVTVRLALSNYVHATETGVTLTVLAGWRSGEAAAGPIAVTNNSTFAAALPIFRWADVPYQRVAGPVTLELTVFSHHPDGVQPVAGVKFTVTDGTNVKTAWATALSTSTRYDDAVRVYSVTIDAAAAPALTAGLLRCDAEVYPWLGAMRSTDTAGTRSMSGLDTAGYGDAATVPFVVGYDPAGTRYGAQVLYIDPAGTATAAATMVKADLAAAKAIAVAARPRDISTAIQALYLANKTLPAANGQPVRLRATDAARLVLAPGIHTGVGATSVTAGITSAELAIGIEGDPDDANPRAACILRTGTVLGLRIARIALSNLSIENGGTALWSVPYNRLDRVDIRAKAGSESSGTALFTSAVANQAPLSATRSKWWRGNTGFRGSTMRFGLLRACEASSRADALCNLGHRFIPAAEDGLSAGSPDVAGSWSGATTLGSAEDVIIAGGDMRACTGRVWQPASLAPGTAGTPRPSLRRLVFANNLCERIGTDPQPFWSMGEDGSATISYNIVEGNSFIGERCNIMYSDPVPTTVADTDTQLNDAFGNRVANNSFDWAATKHDAFSDNTTLAVRTAAGVPSPTGYRPQMVETWSVLYGVGWAGNYDFGRHASAGNFQFEYFGQRSVQVVGGVPAWPVDRSTFGSPATGGGTYRPPAASPLIGRATRASVDRDRTGAVRTVPFASGAVDTPSGAPVALAPATAAQASRAGSPLVGWSSALVPATGRCWPSSGAPLLGWAGTLAAAGGRLVMAAGAPVVGFASVLAPADGALAQAAGGPAIEVGGFVLAPDGGVATMADIGVAVLPDLLFSTPRLVRIEGEVRIQIIPED